MRDLSSRVRLGSREITCVVACYGPRMSSSAIGLKVFSATKARDRDGLSDKITSWLRENPSLEVFDKIVTQSSDAEFHCFTITLFYRTV